MLRLDIMLFQCLQSYGIIVAVVLIICYAEKKIEFSFLVVDVLQYDKPYPFKLKLLIQLQHRLYRINM